MYRLLNNRPARRIAALALVGATIVAAVAGSTAEAATRTAKLGNSWTFELSGNPSTGYTWVLNAGKSTGLEAVKVESLGYAKGTKSKNNLLGAPEQFVFRLTCVAAGSAHLSFDYVGPSGQYAKSHEDWVRCE